MTVTLVSTILSALHSPRCLVLTASFVRPQLSHIVDWLSVLSGALGLPDVAGASKVGSIQPIDPICDCPGTVITIEVTVLAARLCLPPLCRRVALIAPSRHVTRSCFKPQVGAATPLLSPWVVLIDPIFGIVQSAVATNFFDRCRSRSCWMFC